MAKSCVQRGTYQLASGQVSDTYVDLRRITLTTEGAYVIGTLILDELPLETPVSAIGGPALGAIPIVVAVLTLNAAGGSWFNLSGFWVRSEAKDHGNQFLIEGPLQKGQSVVLVDDVVTSGRSVLRTATVVKSLGCKVVQIYALLDREAGADQLIADHGYSYHPFLRLSEVAGGSR